MKTKIYLAKSNRANPDHVMWVRSILAKYPKDIEIVEFTGGAYSHKDLKTCDILLIIPDLSEYNDNEDDFINIGKGLHEQIFAFKNISPNKCDTLVVIDCDKNYTMIVPVDDIDVADEDDYINYSTILLGYDAVAGDLDWTLQNRFVTGGSGATKGSFNEMMYLLIGK